MAISTFYSKKTPAPINYEQASYLNATEGNVIDGIVAAIMALDRCIRHEGDTVGSVYDDPDHGLLVF